MSYKKYDFGNAPDGVPVEMIEIKNSNGMTAKLLTYGAILNSLYVPDKNGNMTDVVLGYDKLEPYFDNEAGYGSIIGRNANRIANASFVLNGKKYNLEKNEGTTNLHSGFLGYHKRVWYHEIYEDELGTGVAFSYYSINGDQGFPGNLNVTVTYILTEDNSLIINYYAVPDEGTVINMTNHSYFNLSGHNSGSALDHKVWIDSDKITCADEKAIPDGREIPVKGTPFDFNTPKRVGDDINSDYDQIVWGKGYDRNFVLKTVKGRASLVAKVTDDKSGREMDIYTDLPGLQMYTGNYLGTSGMGKDGYVYKDYDGIAFEAQFPPNAINIKEFPQPVTKANERYEYVVMYRFKNI